ncbi:MAG: DoxX family protein [Limnohabitans sp.]|nr:DoxX family protein [Limnohabitans sp.]
MNPKIKSIITWTLIGLLVFVFTVSGITKLIGAEMQIKNLESWGYPLWLRFPIGVSEIGMGIGLLLPKLRKLTLFGIFPWAIIAVITHLQAGQTNMIATPILIALFTLIIIRILRLK